MDILYIILFVVSFFFIGISLLALNYQKDEIDRLHSEIFILNDAIDELYDEVFPDEY